ncbi:prepilin-type N-terminal cleavage/methylation domain protein [Luminiphilus syltensis NOR5-1B]|uniref:Prepilin-type N-terminal cleavage/methylation domain protein n=1 Tax=Luminiphilus syltensis NOR5-1B TaxID=565045 RepID=B8KUV5_9GAMM|nr:type IV pilus modification protein PilV [Luminiphilus syltensis]EED36547.1 prepilin-type N-terminal cleavage/methylation domain protein [Luminiphilus syltensis NOR5-1B]
MIESRLALQQRGFTLMEVLVTVLILSIGLLGAAQMQIQSQKYSYASAQRALAIVQVSDLAERLWNGACDIQADPATASAAIVTAWEAAHTGGTLGSWTGAATLTGTTGDPSFRFDITVTWQDNRFDLSESLSRTVVIPSLAGCV